MRIVYDNVCIDLYSSISIYAIYIYIYRFQPVYPTIRDTRDIHVTPIDIEQFDTNQTTFRNILGKLTIIKYTKPEPMTGPQTITYLTQIFEEQKNMVILYSYTIYIYLFIYFIYFLYNTSLPN